MPNNKIAILSFSGGVDSTSLLLRLLQRGYYVHPITFRYGQKHEIEIKFAKRNFNYFKDNGMLLGGHRIVDLSSLTQFFDSSLINKEENVPEGYYESENMLSTFVPNRNAIFLSMLYGYAVSKAKSDKSKIYLSIGAHAGDHAIYPDCRVEFFQKIFEAFAIGNWNSENIELYLPYIDYTKSGILLDAEKNALSLGLDFNTIFKNTITSYNPGKDGRSSGRSGSDVERILAFHKLGKKDPLEYQDSWDNILQYAMNEEKKFKNKN